MQKNEGTIDRWIRAILGILIIYLAHQVFSGVGQIVGYILGVIVLITALTGYCLLYQILGINTKQKQ
jgi:hypothetical protein